MEDTSTTANGTTSERFTDEERAAIKERANELRSTARPGPKADGESVVLAKIAEMPDADRAIAERLHAVIKAVAPGSCRNSGMGCPLTPRTAKSSASSRARTNSRHGTRRSASTTLRTSTMALCGRRPSR